MRYRTHLRTYLLDTHLLLWAAFEPDRLSHEAITIISNEDNSLFFSAANLWEISIKSSLGRDDFNIDVQYFRIALIDHGYHELPITGIHINSLANMPYHHKDPFDRILIAQSQSEGYTLLSVDSVFHHYSGNIHTV